MSSGPLRPSEAPLHARYDVAMLDLDGVVYRGERPVDGAPLHLARARAAGLRLAFITNNAARPPQEVAAHLAALEVPAVAADVVTSAQAAAAVLVRRFGVGARVCGVGGPGLELALREVGLVLTDLDDLPAAIVTGYGPDVPWRRIMQAAVAIRAGLPWVACNTDDTLPTADGVAPGHGALVDLWSRFSGVVPEVAGKPARPLLDETVARMGATRPLMVGDRLDTDISGGANAGIDTLLVLTGVTGLAELVAARTEERPTYLAADLGGLLEPHPAVVEQDGIHMVGGWSADCRDGVLRVGGAGGGSDWWRAVASAAWAFTDASGRVADIAGLGVPEVGAPAR